MKYLIIPILLLFTSCIELQQTIPPYQPAREIADNVFKVQPAYGESLTDIYVYTIDSCEYLGNESLTFNSALLTHKGNCKYCIQRNNKH